LDDACCCGRIGHDESKLLPVVVVVIEDEHDGGELLFIKF
jgi:hypothetical protein